LSRFALKFNKDDLVGTVRNLCKPPVPKFPFTFVGWNGATLSGTAPVAVKGCRKSAG
jgi:hypothetical protein